MLPLHHIGMIEEEIPLHRLPSSHSLMFIFNVDGDGLLDTYYGSRQPIMGSAVAIFCLVYYVALPTM